jgi:hypothetical protein
VGTGSGHVLLYDLRSSRPMMVKDHLYRLPIVDIKYHRSPLSSSPLILSTDQKILKIWHPDNGKNFANIEPGIYYYLFIIYFLKYLFKYSFIFILFLLTGGQGRS